MASEQVADPKPDNLATEATTGQDGSLLTGESQASNAQERPAWMAQLPKELQSDAALTKFKTISELGQSYKALEGKLGSSLTPPKEDAPAEEWQAFYRKIGAPETPNDYALDKSKVPAEIYSEELEQSFRTWAHAAGLTKSQASALFEKYNDMAQGIYNRQVAAIRAEKEKAEGSLRKEWGADADSNFALVQRAFAKFGSPEVAKVMAKTGAGNHPEVVKMFAKIGQALREAPILTGESSGEKKSYAEILYGGGQSK